MIQHDPGQTDQHHPEQDLRGVVEFLSRKDHVAQTGLSGEHLAGDDGAPCKADRQT